MTTTSYLTVPSNLTDALFRDWGSKLSAAMSAIGLVKTSDTGQIDWGTVLAPSAINTVQGYEMYRFNDSLQATYPIFLKIEYGSSSTVTNPSTWWTIGAATNGAGTLSNTLSNRSQQSVSTAGVLEYKCYASMLPNGSGMVWAGYGAGGSNLYRAALFERSCDSSGVPNGLGTVSIVKTGFNAHTMYAANYATKVISISNHPGVVSPDTSMLSPAGVAPVFPTYASFPGCGWFTRTAVACNPTDMGATETAFQVSGPPGYGTFLNTGVAYWGAGGNSAPTLAIAWS